MVHSKLCLLLAASAAVSLSGFSAYAAKTTDPLQCRAKTEKAAVACCQRSTLKFKPKWFTESGLNCKQVVHCGGPLDIKDRCRAEIPPPPTNSNNPPPPPPPPTTNNDISDFRLKKNIQLVGTTVYGLPLYDFQYVNRPGVFEGVMAQDVLKVMPLAVTIGVDGFYRVNYTMLGIEMKRLH